MRPKAKTFAAVQRLAAASGFARDDEHFASAVAFLANAQRLELHSLWLVAAEASVFLDLPGKVAFWTWSTWRRLAVDVIKSTHQVINHEGAST